MTPAWQTTPFTSSIPFTRELGYALIHSLWQGAAVTAALSLVLALLPKRSAPARYLAGCVALAAILAWPAATAALRFAHAAPPASDGVTISAPLPVTPSSAAPSPSTASTSSHAQSLTLGQMLPLVAWLWLAGVGVLSAWNLAGWLRVRRLGRTADAAPVRLQHTLADLCGRIRLARNVAVRLCNQVAAPAVIGVIRPVVLVPASALSELSADHLQALLLHELAHVKRHDYLVNLLQTAAETLLFYHPAVWWISSQIRRERENCCDDLAARHCGSPALYARALAAMEEVRGALVPSFALAALGNGKLLRRIERLIAPPPRSPRHASPFVATAALIALITAATLILTHPSNLNAQAKDSTTTHPNPPAATAPANTILPEDLEALKPTDYKITPNDLLAVTIADLNGPGSETIKQTRVTESGNISLPFLNAPIHAKGLTEIQLERLIVQTYRDIHLIQNANVSVAVVEARGRSFNIVGAVNAPGTYPILDSNFRLLKAIALAHGTLPPSQISSIRVLRPQDDKPTRTIDIPATQALEGDERCNIVIRPGDTILVNQAASSPIVVRLQVGAASIRFQDAPTTWEKLDDLLSVLPNRRDTTLEIIPDSPDLPVGKYLAARARALDLVTKWGLKNLSLGPVENAK